MHLPMVPQSLTLQMIHVKSFKPPLQKLHQHTLGRIEVPQLTADPRVNTYARTNLLIALVVLQRQSQCLSL